MVDGNKNLNMYRHGNIKKFCHKFIKNIERNKHSFSGKLQ